MELLVQWATILSPIIAVLIAWWASWSGRKDTATHISALAENTEKQIKSIKRLARLQIEVTRLQLEKELMDAQQNHLNSQKIISDAEDMNKSPFSCYGDIRDIMSRKAQEKSLSYQKDFYKSQYKNLEQYLSRLKVLEKELDSNS